jgi:hypothetical protein
VKRISEHVTSDSLKNKFEMNDAEDVQTVPYVRDVCQEAACKDLVVK